jgi:hypothetical protein
VLTVPVAGGPVATVASDVSGGIFLVADATSLYWSTDRAGAGPDVLLQVSLQGGNIITLASGLTCPCEIAAYECDCLLDRER